MIHPPGTASAATWRGDGTRSCRSGRGVRPAPMPRALRGFARRDARRPSRGGRRDGHVVGVGQRPCSAPPGSSAEGAGSPTRRSSTGCAGVSSKTLDALDARLFIDRFRDGLALRSARLFWPVSWHCVGYHKRWLRFRRRRTAWLSLLGLIEKRVRPHSKEMSKYRLSRALEHERPIVRAEMRGRDEYGAKAHRGPRFPPQRGTQRGSIACKASSAPPWRTLSQR